ncbi:glycosyltransferase family 4 protein [Microvenator marinus]|uniref:Glycosyltransferase family 4 protein n=1 Tax=Microvenator marinus TaxID=2600177 RepID=A0A5B8XXG6_9DELT|nr:glycosyltransferase [Microvenator marinus]QED28703.1 glycosyltransferase family 4 protein [Microvenator marinus]
MMKTPHVVYVTFDGIMEPLGESQVVRFVEGINAVCDVKFTIVSLEKGSDLRNLVRQNEMRRRLLQQGIDWVFEQYRAGAVGVCGNLALIARIVGQIADNQGIDLLHARSYLPALVCETMQVAHDIPVIFDFRGYWIDERIEEGRWFTNPLSIEVGRMIERHLFQNATAIVSLTHTAAKDIQEGRFGNVSAPIVVIPTCVDTVRFNLSHRMAPRPAPLAGKNVIGWVGSLNTSYLVDESLELTRWILDEDPNAFFFALTKQVSDFRERALRRGVPQARMLIQSVEHSEVPRWMGCMDWGLLLLKENVAKRASMPTKLAEFLACGVRPIYHSCNEDMANVMMKSQSGIRVDLGRALRDIAMEVTRSDKVSVDNGWDPVETHLGLRAGVERYARLYRTLSQYQSTRIDVAEREF